jgi:hypothetical protein
MSDALGGKIIHSKNVTYDDLRALIITDYSNNRQKSLEDLKSTRLPRLDAALGGSKTSDVTTASVERNKTPSTQGRLGACDSQPRARDIEGDV